MVAALVMENAQEMERIRMVRPTGEEGLVERSSLIELALLMKGKRAAELIGHDVE
jgi:hypothetical protein